MDESFDGDGKLTLAFSGNAYATAAAVQPDGKLIVAGCASNGNDDDFALARFNADGTLDTTFGDDGKITTDFGHDETITSLVIQSDGKIVAGGHTHIGNDNDLIISPWPAIILMDLWIRRLAMAEK